MKITWGKVVTVVIILAMVAVMRAIDTGLLDISNYIPSVQVGK